MSAMGLVFIVFARQIAALFIDDPQVIDFTVTFMYALGAAQPLMAIDWTITGALRGAGDSQFPLYGSLAGFYGVRLFVTILIARQHGPIVWIWWSLLVDYIVRSSIKGWRFRSGRWMTVQV
jgi:Na+-driven multidrug efflux pump